MKKGIALLFVIFLTAIFMVLAVIIVKIVYNDRVIIQALRQREEAFWLAEAGIEKGKVELNHNPGWYTDLPYFSPDNINWLKAGAAGDRMILEKGWFKIVREKDKNYFYSLGFRGNAVVILKLEENKKWSII